MTINDLEGEEEIEKKMEATSIEILMICNVKEVFHNWDTKLSWKKKNIFDWFSHRCAFNY